MIPFLPPGPPLFVGEAVEGPLGRCEEIRTALELGATYGAGAEESELVKAVALCLTNGGAPALVLRVAAPLSGGPPGVADYLAAFETLAREGPRFGLLVLPRGSVAAPAPAVLYAAASQLCRERRAILLLEPPPEWTDVEAAVAGLPALTQDLVVENAALFVPRLLLSAALGAGAVGPAGAVAGLLAHNDRKRGVWKAPAGTDAVLSGATGPAMQIDQRANEQLSRLGIDAIRQFRSDLHLWGTRTLAGADAADGEWKYIPVRRLALAIEDSLEQGLQWAVFEPNHQPLWEAVRLSVGDLLHGLFVQGAFAGNAERDAWYVRCGHGTTMTDDDIAAGNLNVEIGIAPVRPAEFIVLRFGTKVAGSTV